MLPRILKNDLIKQFLFLHIRDIISLGNVILQYLFEGLVVC